MLCLHLRAGFEAPSRELEAKAKELKQAATSSSVSTAPSFISISELADQSNCSSVLGTINGERVEGTRWLNMPRVSEPKNLSTPSVGAPSQGRRLLVR